MTPDVSELPSFQVRGNAGHVFGQSMPECLAVLSCGPNKQQTHEWHSTCQSSASSRRTSLELSISFSSRPCSSAGRDAAHSALLQALVTDHARYGFVSQSQGGIAKRRSSSSQNPATKLHSDRCSSVACSSGTVSVPHAVCSGTASSCITSYLDAPQGNVLPAWPAFSTESTSPTSNGQLASSSTPATQHVHEQRISVLPAFHGQQDQQPAPPAEDEACELTQYLLPALSPQAGKGLHGAAPHHSHSTKPPRSSSSQGTVRSRTQAGASVAASTAPCHPSRLSTNSTCPDHPCAVLRHSWAEGFMIDEAAAAAQDEAPLCESYHVNPLSDMASAALLANSLGMGSHTPRRASVAVAEQQLVWRELLQLRDEGSAGGSGSGSGLSPCCTMDATHSCGLTTATHMASTSTFTTTSLISSRQSNPPSASEYPAAATGLPAPASYSQAGGSLGMRLGAGSACWSQEGLPHLSCRTSRDHDALTLAPPVQHGAGCPNQGVAGSPLQPAPLAAPDASADCVHPDVAMVWPLCLPACSSSGSTNSPTAANSICQIAVCVTPPRPLADKTLTQQEPLAAAVMASFMLSGSTLAQVTVQGNGAVAGLPRLPPLTVVNVFAQHGSAVGASVNVMAAPEDMSLELQSLFARLVERHLLATHPPANAPAAGAASDHTLQARSSPTRSGEQAGAGRSGLPEEWMCEIASLRAPSVQLLPWQLCPPVWAACQGVWEEVLLPLLNDLTYLVLCVPGCFSHGIIDWDRCMYCETLARVVGQLEEHALWQTLARLLQYCGTHGVVLMYKGEPLAHTPDALSATHLQMLLKGALHSEIGISTTPAATPWAASLRKGSSSGLFLSPPRSSRLSFASPSAEPPASHPAPSACSHVSIAQCSASSAGGLLGLMRWASSGRTATAAASPGSSKGWDKESASPTAAAPSGSVRRTVRAEAADTPQHSNSGTFSSSAVEASIAETAVALTSWRRQSLDSHARQVAHKAGGSISYGGGGGSGVKSAPRVVTRLDAPAPLPHELCLSAARLAVPRGHARRLSDTSGLSHSPSSPMAAASVAALSAAGVCSEAPRSALPRPSRQSLDSRADASAALGCVAHRWSLQGMMLRWRPACGPAIAESPICGRPDDDAAAQAGVTAVHGQLPVEGAGMGVRGERESMGGNEVLYFSSPHSALLEASLEHAACGSGGYSRSGRSSASTCCYVRSSNSSRGSVLSAAATCDVAPAVCSRGAGQGAVHTFPVPTASLTQVPCTARVSSTCVDSAMGPSGAQPALVAVVRSACVLSHPSRTASPRPSSEGARGSGPGFNRSRGAGDVSPARPSPLAAGLIGRPRNASRSSSPSLSSSANVPTRGSAHDYSRSSRAVWRAMCAPVLMELQAGKDQKGQLVQAAMQGEGFQWRAFLLEGGAGIALLGLLFMLLEVLLRQHERM